MAPEDDHGRCHMTILEVVMWHVVLHVPGGPPPWGWCQVSGVAPWGGVMCLPCGWCQVVLYLVGGVRWSSTWWVVLYLVGGVRCGPLGRCHMTILEVVMWHHPVGGVRCQVSHPGVVSYRPWSHVLWRCHVSWTSGGWCHVSHGSLGAVSAGRCQLGGVSSVIWWLCVWS